MSSQNTSLSYLALQKFKRNFWGIFSFWCIVIAFLLAVFAYVIAPDNSANANQMALAIHSQRPGFKVKVLEIPNASTDKISFFNRMFFGNPNPSEEIPVLEVQLLEDKLVYFPFNSEGEKSMASEVSLANFPNDISAEALISTYVKNKTFWLGTDRYGRDMLSRMLIGLRISLSIGLIAVFISLLVGISLGAMAGYFGGRVDAFIMWLINVTWSIPTLLLVIAITLALGKGYWQVFIAVGLTMWVEVARIVRGQFISLKEMPYVTAAKALGFGHFRIIKNHILPNALAPVIVISAANFASAILVESGLSFLGIGAQPPTPSWGGMIKDHYSYILLGKAYLAVIPGMGIMLLVMAFMLMGNALRDALDVKG
jgi:peptide/nickel transport system permease protein